MNAKTIFILIIAVLLTIILMKNTEEVSFWIFGEYLIPKLTILGVIFLLGLIVGFLLGRPRKKEILLENSPDQHSSTFKDTSETISGTRNKLSDEDRDYIN